MYQNLIEIYTDGSWTSYKNAGGYGVVILCKEKKLRKEISEGYSNTTNNRMELMAAIAGLKALKRKCTVRIYSDSQYIVKPVTEGWLFKWEKDNFVDNFGGMRKNHDLWKEYIKYFNMHKVEMVWIKAHNGDIENERCDFLAKQASTQKELIKDI